jgi:hypothetical protein
VVAAVGVPRGAYAIAGPDHLPGSHVGNLAVAGVQLSRGRVTRQRRQSSGATSHAVHHGRDVGVLFGWSSQHSGGSTNRLVCLSSHDLPDRDGEIVARLNAANRLGQHLVGLGLVHRFSPAIAISHAWPSNKRLD